MYSLRALEFKGYRQEAVPNTFFQQDDATDHAALVLPGRGYSSQGPVLSYPRLELLARGADVLCVDYTQRADFSTLPDQELLRCSIADAEAGYRALMKQRPYQRITLVGKSLGTMVMTHFLTTLSLPTPVLTAWLTPVLSVEKVRTQIKQAPGPVFVAIGTADPYYNAAQVAEIREALQDRGEVLVIEHANHSLDIGTSALQSLAAIEEMIRSFQTVLDKQP
ncbi:MAG TPA: alpha/beta family hydrolase [Ktedonobacteraceae bacterium]|nr:alpha/beta family hydrolase [Ktedonobacteraceae bacterium]